MKSIDIQIINERMRELGLVVRTVRDGELLLDFDMRANAVADVDFENIAARITERLNAIPEALPGITSISVGITSKYE